MAWSETKCLGEHSLASCADAGSHRFLALFLIALFRVKTVNLAELSTGFMGQAKAESNAAHSRHRLRRRLERIRVRSDYKDFYENLI